MENAFLLDQFCQWLRANKLLIAYSFEDNYFDAAKGEIKTYKTLKPAGKSDHMLVRTFLEQSAETASRQQIANDAGEVLHVEFQEE